MFIVDKDQEIRCSLIHEDCVVEEQHATAPSIIDHYLTYLLGTSVAPFDKTILFEFITLPR